MAWIAADAKARSDAAQARHDAAREGLKPDTFRDPMGLVRYEQTGRIVPDASVQAYAKRKRERFDQIDRNNHL